MPKILRYHSLHSLSFKSDYMQISNSNCNYKLNFNLYIIRYIELTNKLNIWFLHAAFITRLVIIFTFNIFYSRNSKMTTKTHLMSRHLMKALNQVKYCTVKLLCRRAIKSCNTHENFGKPVYEFLSDLVGWRLLRIPYTLATTSL